MNRYKVFLSHNSADKPAVEALALRLRQETDIEPWLDKWNLIPGQPWQEELEVAMKGCDSCVIFIGRGDPQSGVMGPWQNAEMRALISRQVSERGSKFAVIPVLLPGAERGQRSTLPTFLVANTWVEFRRTHDEPDALQRLLAGIRGEKPGPPTGSHPALGECPYRGLEFFDVAHADRFFGREAVTQWLVDDVRKPLRPGSELPRFLAILGASGSGKSSLARAGLYAELKNNAIQGSRDWLFVPPVRPGPNPLESLELAVLQAAAGSPQLEAVRHELRELAQKPDRLHRAARLLVPDTSPPRRLFLLVDQFEEVFTTCENEDLRCAFIATLLHAARERGGPVVVALTMRADFFGKVAAYEELARVFDQHQYLVGPMSEVELQQAIEEPALRAGAEFEPGLVNALLEDVHRQPGALALLEHALLELWNRREDGRKLTHDAYKTIGRLEGALERRANEVFRQFSADDQELCRRAFLRLVHSGEGAEDTRRRVEFRELLALGDGPRIQKLIATLAAPDARLVVTEGGEAPQRGGFVEVAHETLIRSWSQLRKWLDADRAGLRTQRRLTEAAREWDEGGRKPDFLYRGGRLGMACEWRVKHSGDLNALEREFLDASEQQRKEEQDQEVRREQERTRIAEQALEAQRRAKSRLAKWTVTAAVVGLLALCAMGTALLLYSLAESERERSYALASRALEIVMTTDESRLEGALIDPAESYGLILRELTPDYIAKADVSLQPGLWFKRGWASWRMARYNEAYESSVHGNAVVRDLSSVSPATEHTQPSVLLTMLPGLVLDSQLRGDLEATGGNLTAASYRTNFLPRFKAVFTQFGEAHRRFAAPTPPAVQNYWYLQAWRVLQNWRITLGKLPLGEEATRQAYIEAHHYVANRLPGLAASTNLEDAIRIVKESIPDYHAYRRSINDLESR